MKKTLLLIFVFVPTIYLRAQYSSDFIKTDDIYKALNLIGLNIYKYAITADSTYNFNLQYEEYLHGKCVDSSKLINNETLLMLKNVLQANLTINKDTTFLNIISQQKSDSIFTINFSFSAFLSKKEIVCSNSKYGDHKLREFASPKIKDPGKYPVLLLSTPWKQEINGKTVMRYCFPEDIQSIRQMAEHFYVISVVAIK